MLHAGSVSAAVSKLFLLDDGQLGTNSTCLVSRVTGHLPYHYATSLGKRYQSPDSEALFGNIPNPCGV